MDAEAEQVDLRPVGLAAVSWGAMWLASSGRVEVLGAAWLGPLVLVAAAHRRRSWYLAALALVAAACLTAGGVRVWGQGASPVRALAAERAVATVEVTVGAGRLLPAAGVRPERWFATGRLDAVEARGRAWRGGAVVELTASGDQARAWASVPLGTRVRAVVSLAEPDADAGREAVVRAREPPRAVAGPGAVDRTVQALRDGLRRASDPLAPDARALVPALVVGDTSRITDELADRFRVTGLTHLTAVSGANLTLLLVFLRAVAVGLGVRGHALTVVLVGGVAAFVLLCLGEPSVVRAAGMGLVGLAALGWGGGRRQGVRFLSIAVLVLVFVDPWLSRSLGFALSVTASAGLLWWAARWTAVLSGWLPRWAAEAVAVPLAAQLATEPIVVALSGRVSLVGLLANALAGPLVGPATVLGFVATGLSVVWLPAAVACAWLAGWCAQGLCWLARLGDALPGAAVPWPATPGSVLLVTVACLLASLVLPALLARRGLTLALAALLVVALARTPTPPGWPPGAWDVVVCDVGQGDAVVLNAGAGAGVLVDAGPDPRLLGACLDQVGVSAVPLVFVTHPHADHIGGLPAVADRGVRRFVTSSDARAGASWTVGRVLVEVMAAPPTPSDDPAGPGEGESSAVNDASLLLRATVGELTVLLAGDAEEQGQERHLGLGGRLDVDVLLVPHHGSSRQSPAFLELTRPRVAVVSVGAGNDYGHPTARTLRLVSGLDAVVVRTDEAGAVAVSRRAGSLLVTTQRGP